MTDDPKQITPFILRLIAHGIHTMGDAYSAQAIREAADLIEAQAARIADLEAAQ